MTVYLFRAAPDGVEIPDAWVAPTHEYPDGPVCDEGPVILRDWGTAPSIMTTSGLAHWTKQGIEREMAARNTIAILDDPRVGKRDRVTRDARLVQTLGGSAKVVTGFGMYHGDCLPGPVLYRGAMEADRNLSQALKATGGDSAGIAWVPAVGYYRRAGYGWTSPHALAMLAGMARDYGCEGLVLWSEPTITDSEWKQTVEALAGAGWAEGGAV